MVKWLASDGFIAYPDALDTMQSITRDIHQGGQECIWLLEHPPLYTAGTSAKPQDLLMADRFPVFETGRGGQYTYHGPGQRVAYIMLDLNQRKPDLRWFVQELENWIIRILAEFGVTGFQREGRVGIWTDTPNGEAKIAAIGVRVSKWVTYHGIAINVHPDLSHFSGIVPCGLPQFGVTSLHDLGINVTMEQVDEALKQTCLF
ncbi:MAG: lipoyl(octanoyl) transferase LipB [Candidatus Paracaedibacteraceae bacterium]|nr:lipoyl(octanoyl) transferase LipB [Candidatus Paracaedibacteraceae bacterium]